VLNTGEISAADLERIYLQYMQAGLRVAEAAL
jgi:hypothetical protein